MLLGALVAGVALQLQGVEFVQRPVAPAPEVVIDGVVATLELNGDRTPRYVLRSEYTLLLRLEVASHGMPDAFTAPIAASTAWPVLETLLGETLAVREAERSDVTNLSRLDAAAVGALRARVREALTRRQRLDPATGEPKIAELLAAVGLTQSDFDTLLRRRLVARAYLEARHENLLAVSEVDLRRAVESHAYDSQCAGEGDANVQRRCVRAEMQWSMLPNALRQYLRSLGGRVRVRVFSEGPIP